MPQPCTKQEVESITGKKTGPAQCRALRAMGITHKARPGIFPLVDRRLVDHLLGVADAGKSAANQEWEPDYAELG
jgi:hypothetical protein